MCHSGSLCDGTGHFARVLWYAIPFPPPLNDCLLPVLAPGMKSVEKQRSKHRPTSLHAWAPQRSKKLGPNSLFLNTTRRPEQEASTSSKRIVPELRIQSQMRNSPESRTRKPRQGKIRGKLHHRANTETSSDTQCMVIPLADKFTSDSISAPDRNNKTNHKFPSPARATLPDWSKETAETFRFWSLSQTASPPGFWSGAPEMFQYPICLIQMLTPCNWKFQGSTLEERDQTANILRLFQPILCPEIIQKSGAPTPWSSSLDHWSASSMAYLAGLPVKQCG